MSGEDGAGYAGELPPMAAERRDDVPAGVGDDVGGVMGLDDVGGGRGMRTRSASVGSLASTASITSDTSYMSAVEDPSSYTDLRGAVKEAPSGAQERSNGASDVVRQRRSADERDSGSEENDDGSRKGGRRRRAEVGRGRERDRRRERRHRDRDRNRGRNRDREHEEDSDRKSRHDRDRRRVDSTDGAGEGEAVDANGGDDDAASRAPARAPRDLRGRDMRKPTGRTKSPGKIPGRRRQLLRFTPDDEVAFALEMHSTSESTLVLENPASSTGLMVAFKIKTTAPDRYLVTPSMGMLEPGTSVVVSVVVQADEATAIFIQQFGEDGSRREAPVADKFLIQSATVEEADLSTEDNVTNLARLWSSSRWKKRLRNKKLPTRYFPKVAVSSDSDDDDEDEDIAASGSGGDAPSAASGGPKRQAPVPESSGSASPLRRGIKGPRRGSGVGPLLGTRAVMPILLPAAKGADGGSDTRPGSAATDGEGSAGDRTRRSSGGSSLRSDGDMPVLPALGSTRSLRVPRTMSSSSIAAASPVPSPRPHFKWRQGELIGTGMSGRVYMGLQLDNNKIMAVKVMEVDSERSQAVLEREISVMRLLSHPNVIRYLGAESDSNGSTVRVFMEYASRGSIAEQLKRSGPFDEATIRVFTKQILRGLRYLHEHTLAHRDVKGANILVAADGAVKLADFGASKATFVQDGGHKLASAPEEVLDALRKAGAVIGERRRAAAGGAGEERDEPSPREQGTPQWMAPEVVTGKVSGRAWQQADIWSVGCTVIEMFTGKPPWVDMSNPLAIMVAIARDGSVPQLPDGLSDDGRSFLQLCLTRDPSKRPTAEDLLKHPFVSVPVSLDFAGSRRGSFRSVGSRPSSRDTTDGSLLRGNQPARRSSGDGKWSEDGEAADGRPRRRSGRRSTEGPVPDEFCSRRRRSSARGLSSDGDDAELREDRKSTAKPMSPRGSLALGLREARGSSNVPKETSPRDERVAASPGISRAPDAVSTPTRQMGDASVSRTPQSRPSSARLRMRADLELARQMQVSEAAHPGMVSPIRTTGGAETPAFSFGKGAASPLRKENTVAREDGTSDANPGSVRVAGDDGASESKDDEAIRSDAVQRTQARPSSARHREKKDKPKRLRRTQTHDSVSSAGSSQTLMATQSFIEKRATLRTVSGLDARLERLFVLIQSLSLPAVEAWDDEFRSTAPIVSQGAPPLPRPLPDSLSVVLAGLSAGDWSTMPPASQFAQVQRAHSKVTKALLEWGMDEVRPPKPVVHEQSQKLLSSVTDDTASSSPPLSESVATLTTAASDSIHAWTEEESSGASPLRSDGGPRAALGEGSGRHASSESEDSSSDSDDEDVVPPLQLPLVTHGIALWWLNAARDRLRLKRDQRRDLRWAYYRTPGTAAASAEAAKEATEEQQRVAETVQFVVADDEAANSAQWLSCGCDRSAAFYAVRQHVVGYRVLTRELKAGHTYLSLMDKLFQRVLSSHESAEATALSHYSELGDSKAANEEDPGTDSDRIVALQDLRFTSQMRAEVVAAQRHYQRHWKPKAESTVHRRARQLDLLCQSLEDAATLCVNEDGLEDWDILRYQPPAYLAQRPASPASALSEAEFTGARDDVSESGVSADGNSVAGTVPHSEDGEEWTAEAVAKAEADGWVWDGEQWTAAPGWVDPAQHNWGEVREADVSADYQYGQQLANYGYGFQQEGQQDSPASSGGEQLTHSQSGSVSGGAAAAMSPESTWAAHGEAFDVDAAGGAGGPAESSSEVDGASEAKRAGEGDAESSEKTSETTTSYAEDNAYSAGDGAYGTHDAYGASEQYPTDGTYAHDGTYTGAYAEGGTYAVDGTYVAPQHAEQQATGAEASYGGDAEYAGDAAYGSQEYSGGYSISGEHATEYSGEYPSGEYAGYGSGEYGEAAYSAEGAAEFGGADTGPVDVSAEKLYVRALADYSAQDDNELSLYENDTIHVLRKDPSGWWEGDCNGRVGWFPSNFVHIKYDLYTIEECDTPRSEVTDGSFTSRTTDGVAGGAVVPAVRVGEADGQLEQIGEGAATDVAL